jgi:hypothetical protein
MITVIKGWSYDEQVRGRQTYSVCEIFEPDAYDAIDRLLTTTWRGRKIAFVEAARVRSMEPRTEEPAGAWVLLKKTGTAPMIVRGRPGDPEIAALLRDGFEYND